MPLLFSYGTLQQADVQLATFGRRLEGRTDELIGCEPSLVIIEDAQVVAALGKTHHANVTYNGTPGNGVPGTVFEITEAELASADQFEAGFAYRRVSATLGSGVQAWVYVHRDGAADWTTGDRVDEKSLFTKFWTDESKTTRNVLARIPEGSDYRPDPKSRTAREIAWQIVCEERMLIDAMERGKAEWSPPPVPATMKEVLEAYEQQSAALVQRWAALPAARWEGSLEFFGSSRPASPMAWSFLFDIVHHRGQISTYLRPMGSTVPQIYGPSGDEP